MGGRRASGCGGGGGAGAVAARGGGVHGLRRGFRQRRGTHRALRGQAPGSSLPQHTEHATLAVRACTVTITVDHLV